MLPVVTPQTILTSRLEAAVQQFENRRKDEALEGLESLFINMMLQEMRKTVPEDDGIFGKSAGMSTMESMMDEFIAQELAKSGQLGIARLAERQLTNQKGINAIGPENVLESLRDAKVEDS